MNVKYCKSCWTPSTRPRITFNEEGVCNACQWSEEKKEIDWDERESFLASICDKYRVGGNTPDMVVPYSGGKDSIYVAYQMKEKYGMTPLLMTVIPHLETEVGEWNRKNMCPGFERFEINLKEDKYKDLAKKYFVGQGRPKHPWECAISAAVITQAVGMNLPFIMYGEEGEAEYGGSSQEKDKWQEPVSHEYLNKFYWQDGQNDWLLPKRIDHVFFTQFSRFENWSPSLHGNFAVAKGMHTEPVRSCGTFTQISQLSDKLQDLHAYMMYVKFGFGRATSDASIALREGWTTRDEALEWVEVYDGEFPNKYLDTYLEYFDMSEAEFASTIAQHANHDMVKRTYKHIWQIHPHIAKYRRKDSILEFTNPRRYG